MKDSVQNPHDKFFKSLMDDKIFAIAFLDEFLPNELKSEIVLAELEPTKSSFVTPELQEYFADVVFNIPLRSNEQNESCYLTILLEHKSYVDDYVDFQILSYLAQSYNHQILNKEKLQLVIPFLYYHGEERWKIKSPEHFFRELPSHMLRYLPRFDKIFVNLLDLEESFIKALGNQLIRSALMVQHYRHQPKKMMEAVFKIFETLDQIPNRNYIKSLIVYTFSVALEYKEIIKEKLKIMPPQIQSEMLTIYDQLIAEGMEKGMEKGMEAGIEQGRKQGAIQYVLKLYDEGMDVNFISKVSNLSLDEVVAILTDHKKM